MPAVGFVIGWWQSAWKELTTEIYPPPPQQEALPTKL